MTTDNQKTTTNSSVSTRFWVRVPLAFKINVQVFVNELFERGMRDDKSLSNYVREAVREKRERDRKDIEQHDSNSRR